MKKSYLLAVKFSAFLLTVVVLFTSIPAGVFSAFFLIQKAPLQMALISDIHYYPQSLMGDKGAAWQKYCDDKSSQYTQTDALVDAALNAIGIHSKKNGCKYLLIPGDLTKDSEYAGNVALAGKLKRFEEKTGIQVLVIDGNHDINDSNASTFKNGKPEKTRATTPQDFRALYSDLGYDLAYHTYTPP
ncbi:MAG: metallophosphoesterase, partial [Eubacteriales bacterium]